MNAIAIEHTPNFWNTSVTVKLKKHCACGEPLSITNRTKLKQDYSTRCVMHQYQKGVCNDCENKAIKVTKPADPKSFFDLKATILNGMTEAEYQKRYGQAWND